MQISDDLFLGPVSRGGPLSDGPSPMDLGVGPMGRVHIFDVVPVALNLLGIATAQAVAAAGNLTLTAGTGTTLVNGAVVLDTPRCVDILSSGAGDTTQTATFYGTDQYGQPMTETITFNGTTRAVGDKAFKSINRIAISATMAGNASSGFTDKIGLPFRVLSRDYINFNYNATVGLLAAVTVADTTSPATATTNDVRGFITLASVADGVKRLVATIALPAIASGPNATRIGALGVTQF